MKSGRLLYLLSFFRAVLIQQLVPWCGPAGAAPLWSPTHSAVSASPAPAQPLASAASAREPHPQLPAALPGEDSKGNTIIEEELFSAPFKIKLL